MHYMLLTKTAVCPLHNLKKIMKCKYTATAHTPCSSLHVQWHASFANKPAIYIYNVFTQR